MSELLTGRIMPRKWITEEYDAQWELRMQKPGDGTRMYRRSFAGIRDVIDNYVALCRAASNGRPNLADYVRSVASLANGFVDLYRQLRPSKRIFVVYYIGSYAQVTKAKAVLGDLFIKIEMPENLDVILHGNEPNFEILSGTAEGFLKYPAAIYRNHNLQQHEVTEALQGLMHQPAH